LIRDGGPAQFGVIVVTHNSAEVVGSLLARLPAGLEIICVDNASADDIGAALAPFPAKLIRNERNLGYGAACNRGAAAATADFLLFLNPDIAIADDALAGIGEAIARYPDCSVFSPRIVDQGGRVENRDYNFLEWAGPRRLIRLRQPFGGDCCIHFLHGGAFAIKRTAFLALGGFDERIFLYYEDDDLAARLLARGEPIIYVHSACVSHGVQRSATPTLRRRYFMNLHKKRSEIYVRRKYGLRYHRAFDIADLCLRVLVYAITFNRFRLFGAAGRLVGAVSRTEVADVRVPDR
jgi:GT2 family glycosyltransferase